jgi:hypothetical protein
MATIGQAKVSVGTPLNTKQLATPWKASIAEADGSKGIKAGFQLPKLNIDKNDIYN